MSTHTYTPYVHTPANDGPASAVTQLGTFTSGNTREEKKTFLHPHTLSHTQICARSWTSASPSLHCCPACGDDGFWWWFSQTGSWTEPCPDPLHCNVCACSYVSMKYCTYSHQCFPVMGGPGGVVGHVRTNLMFDKWVLDPPPSFLTGACIQCGWLAH